ncbi:MAG: bifunctional (p)ppGpp synthetase/guanosine-3',5'-bis(diphosphate) 3'-pyrophosphohydrolase [Hydrogenophaga sp.]|jgi:GTP pyrophosphokinase|nr:bifunctional (p)ppGpp synthetase/guanosine-3',5'-bis(diphosphate) 3'-pyrophosphohydrolase [Hydrogenophaga sp.]MDO9479055.1 bifunctional (p)ppGpp synthetase/guanosine-3',5'-bis(diphosphate) 3'-pyrophosphohydrolase [Hydrogenophaga sp.]MDO9567849.1 bifunctional (p)ppGpp synthetase/guanosine-3',5'-bis(diphosphate) 3'-pyrophosphohydrolase [Hydrogenophaga sp.]MDP1895588.1 bifunctional (p)ppGpp synthetase/guanosine-3',5'-bis(diphosphate) 3'-pyrophosphohydrolase [Hydrogenophaga sp.]MDP2222772.1 bifu
MPSAIVTATSDSLPHHAQALFRARAFAEPLLASEQLDTGENILAHADAVAAILNDIGGSEAMQAASYLVYACQHLNRPQEVIAKAFGDNFAALAVETTKLVQLQRQARVKTAQVQAKKEEERQAAQDQALPLISPGKTPVSELAASQTENVRKMLLAFSRDLRVVMLRLASRLQTLRYFAASKGNPGEAMASESLHVFAPLANRLGIWQIKWEMEDLAFRFLEPYTYKQVARLLDEKRAERETHVEQVRLQLEQDLLRQGVTASVQGRPKHIYSIVKKMRGKSLDFDQVFDIRALRVVVPQVDDCYAVLALVHAQFTPVTEEFDDYIAKPKPNGYQSLHTVVRDSQGRAFEIQIRTQAMHDHAEHGVAAHWAYKEAGAKGYAGVSASSEYDAKIAVLRQLLAWERDLSGTGQGLFDDRIYVLTPDAAIVELPQGATAVDFAYTVHTSLGHRCRGARVDGAMVTLNTPLQNGQTVEITAAKEGGPSRDWLNADLGYLVSHRAKSKVRAWFNAQAMEETVARGREAVEKLLQREGKTALKLDDLAVSMGLSSAQELFEQVGKDELSVRAIETHLRPAEPVAAAEDIPPWLKKPRKQPGRSPGGVLVVGVDSLMTQLAKCCKPAPPDDIGGFVTRGKGVSIHRADCTDFAHLQRKSPDRVIDVQWGGSSNSSRGEGAYYPVDVAVEALDRQGLLRDISDVFAREKMNVIGVQTQSVKGIAWMTFTIEVADARQVARAMSVVGDVAGVRVVRRK